MSLPARALAVLCGLLLAFACGWGAHVRYAAGIEAEQALQGSENAREAERLAAKSMTRKTDALIADRIATERRAAGTAERLRQLAAATPAPAGCPSRDEDTRPAAGLLPDDTRNDLVALAREADAVADRLRACQAGDP